MKDAKGDERAKGRAPRPFLPVRRPNHRVIR